jgi:hypothetical protein
MKTILTVLIVSLAMSAEAARLIAGPLQVETGGLISCALLNVSTGAISDVTVTARVGGATAELGAASVPPETTFGQVEFNNNVSGSEAGWCVFDFAAGKRKVRATACVLPNLGASCSAAVVAQ